MVGKRIQRQKEPEVPVVPWKVGPFHVAVEIVYFFKVTFSIITVWRTGSQAYQGLNQGLLGKQLPAHY